MRKSNFVFYGLMLIGLIGFGSCGDDAAEENMDPATIAFTNTTTTYNRGQTVVLTASASAPGELKDIALEVKFPGESAFAGLDIKTSFSNPKSDNYLYEWTTNTSIPKGEYEFRVTVRQNSGPSASASITITLTDQATALSEITLGGRSSSLPSFFVLSEGQNGAKDLAYAEENEEKIDFLFNAGPTNKATFYALTNSSVPSIFPTLDYTTVKATKFKKGTEADYASTTDLQLATAYNAATGEDDLAKELQVGDVILLKQDPTGAVFAIKVLEISGTGTSNSDSIKFTVKGVF